MVYLAQKCILVFIILSSLETYFNSKRHKHCLGVSGPTHASPNKFIVMTLSIKMFRFCFTSYVNVQKLTIRGGVEWVQQKYNIHTLGVFWPLPFQKVKQTKEHWSSKEYLIHCQILFCCHIDLSFKLIWRNCGRDKARP